MFSKIDIKAAGLSLMEVAFSSVTRNERLLTTMCKILSVSISISPRYSTQSVLPSACLGSPGLRILLVWDWFVEVRLREGSHAPLLLSNCLLPVPALEEDLLGVRVEEANHPEVRHDLRPSDIQLCTRRGSLQSQQSRVLNIFRGA